MPFIGEQPAESATLLIPARSGSNVTIELTVPGTITVTTRSGTVNVGVT
tara:strand:- start:159 stop:305 length:147 start_codon:yes stop_codon:yes gene_type:complete